MHTPGGLRPRARRRPRTEPEIETQNTMERLKNLAEEGTRREPSLDEAIELLLYMATGPYGVTPDTARAVLQYSVDQTLKSLSPAAASVLEACRADARRVAMIGPPGRCGQSPDGSEALI